MLAFKSKIVIESDFSPTYSCKCTHNTYTNII